MESGKKHLLDTLLQRPAAVPPVPVAAPRPAPDYTFDPAAVRDQALAVLRDAMLSDETPAATRVAAAREILDRIDGRPRAIGEPAAAGDDIRESLASFLDTIDRGLLPAD